jgi:predicted transcriptional regulator
MPNKLLEERISRWEERMAALGITPYKFCEKCDISYDTYRRLSNPTIETLDRIEKALRKMEG